MRSLLRGSSVLASFALGLCWCLPATSTAATTLGSTSVPSAPTCGQTLQTLVQVTSPGSMYTVPTPGVITSWSHQAASAPATTMRLRVVRPTPTAGTYTTVGLSTAQVPVANQLTSFPSRIPVAAGDLIGFSVTATTAFDCLTASPGATISYRNDAPAVSSVDPYPDLGFAARLAISAQLEPDADGDGFGDETQDACPTDATTQGPCPDRIAPDTTITKSPSGETKKKRATFAFTATEAGSTFECAIDGSAFKPCTSPLIKTFRLGRHVFQVRAVDAAGNADATPAAQSWKVVKKRKKGHKH